jgi:antitoxin (DNA-binding transcriptional repressor) of toxin-antitoxin stability system
MSMIGVPELRQNVNEILCEGEACETVTVTVAFRPLAKIVSFLGTVPAAITSLLSLRSGLATKRENPQTMATRRTITLMTFHMFPRECIFTQP